MNFSVRRIDYYYIRVEDRPGKAYELLTLLAQNGVNLLVFGGMPIGPQQTQLTLFPEESGKLEAAARGAGIVLDGPNPALLVQGDDELGALAGIHAKLLAAGVNVFSSSGVADGSGRFSYVLYLRPDDIDSAARALGI